MVPSDYLKGHILSYEASRRVGLIKPEEGANLGFRLEDVLVPKALLVGREVRFKCDPADHFAYKIHIRGGPRAQISRRQAALRAILGGAFGMHKFYMGYGWVGTLMLFATLFSWIFFFLPLFIVIGISVWEGFTYLRLSNKEFDKRYLQERRALF